MAIGYKSAGTGVATESSGGNLNPTWPATVDAGDIAVAHVFWEGTTTTPDTPAGGWVLLSGPHVIETTIARQWVYGMIAAGTEDGAAVSFGTQAVTTQRGARIYTFSGRVSGTIQQLVRGFSHVSHATDPQGPTCTTLLAGGLAVALVGQNDNNSIDSLTGESGGDWTEAVAEFTANLTPGLMLEIQTCTPTSNPGTVSGGTFNTANDPVGVIGLVIHDVPWGQVTASVAGQTATTVSEGTRRSVAASVDAVSTTASPVTLIEGGEVTQNSATVGGVSGASVSLAVVYAVAAEVGGVSGTEVSVQSVLAMSAGVDAQGGVAADGWAIRSLSAEAGALSTAEAQAAGVYAIGAEVAGTSEAQADVVVPAVFVLEALVEATSTTEAEATLAVEATGGDVSWFLPIRAIQQAAEGVVSATARSVFRLYTSARATVGKVRAGIRSVVSRLSGGSVAAAKADGAASVQISLVGMAQGATRSQASGATLAPSLAGNAAAQAGTVAGSTGAFGGRASSVAAAGSVGSARDVLALHSSATASVAWPNEDEDELILTAYMMLYERRKAA